MKRGFYRLLREFKALGKKKGAMSCAPEYIAWKY